MAEIDRCKHNVKQLAGRRGHDLTRFSRKLKARYHPWVAECRKCGQKFTVHVVNGYYRGLAGQCDDDLDSECPGEVPADDHE